MHVDTGESQRHGSIQYGLLGPLRVTREDAEIPLRRGKVRQLLVALLLETGRPVHEDRLAVALWGFSAPSTARASLSNHVHALRRSLGDTAGDVVRTVAHGYLLRAEPGSIDVQVFEDLLHRGRAAHCTGTWAVASGELSAALALWRGEPLPDLVASEVLAEAAARWSEQRLQALEWRIDADLHLGRHHDVIAELSELTAAHPLRESLAGLLMMAQYQSGRLADALSVYRQTRRVLVEELGTDPGARLQELHQRMLSGDLASVAAQTSGDLLRSSRVPAPAQLPAAIGDFTGRDHEVRQLSGSLTVADQEAVPGAMIIASVTGAGGTGKTALAVHVAHQVAGHFPDGQIFVNLRGTASQPVAVSAILARLLDDLGADPASIPMGDEERAARYRTALAGRRVLLLLDDAHDSRQLGLLLPGTPGCAVMVTSRNRLADLTATARVDLGALTGEQARLLFSRIVGPDRAAAEPEAVSAVLEACAGLPLAVRIAAARLASRPMWTVGVLADRLASERTRLDELSTGDLAVRTSFHVSYQSATDSSVPAGSDATRAFRLLGVALVPEVSLPAAAALVGAPLRDTEQVMEHLVDTHLVETLTPGRYHLHDLMRIFAAEQAEATESARAQADAVSRLLAWYVRTSDGGRHHLPTGSGPFVSCASTPAAPAALRFTGKQQALDWYHAESAGFLPAVRLAAHHGLAELGWQLAATLWSYYRLTRNWSEWIAAYRIGIDCAVKAADLNGQALLLNGLAAAYLDLKRYHEALGYSTRALALRRQSGDLVGQASSLNNLGICLYGLGRPSQAITAFEKSLWLYRRAGDPHGSSSAANNLGNAYLVGNSYELAETYLRQCIALCRDTGNERLAGLSLSNLGEACQKLGRRREAIRHHREALILARRAGEPYGLAHALDMFAITCDDQGLYEESRIYWTEALGIFNRLCATESRSVSARLAALPAPA